jgi:RNA polymerase sigma-70 factor, ECF subfamily
MGDDSFARFYTASYQRLLGQLFAVTGDLAEAENLLQEAYARAFARWSVCVATTARRHGSGGWR